LMGIAEFIIGPAQGRTRWFPPILRAVRKRHPECPAHPPARNPTDSGTIVEGGG
jgi:hypothetical protein